MNGQRIECNDTCTNAIAQLSKLMAQKLTRTIEVYFSSAETQTQPLKCAHHTSGFDQHLARDYLGVNSAIWLWKVFVWTSTQYVRAEM